MIKLVVVDQRMETIGATIPDMLDKRAVMEEFDVLLKELVT